MDSELIKKQGKLIGFDLVGIAHIDRQYEDNSLSHLHQWLKKGYYGEMEWMKNPKREDVKLLLPSVRSIISVALNYYTPYNHSNHPEIGKISRYGWGKDYHKIVHKKLKQFTQWLKDQNSTIEAIYYGDTGPIQDKTWAQRAGLGWISKNSNLITRDYGSWVFLGEILTNLDLKPDLPHTSHCGTCTRCITACPTNAIIEPFIVDANRCIAYHTIENRAEILPPDLNLKGWVAGCDICQDVCPWNQRFAKPTSITEFNPLPHNITPSLQELAQLSEQDWDQRFRGSALRRIKPQMWRRNAQKVLKERENQE